MRGSDLVLGLLIILLLGWIMLVAVQQHSISVGLQALEAKQVAQGIQLSPDKCAPLSSHSLVKASDLEEKQYITTVGFDSEQKQVYFCFYE